MAKQLPHVPEMGAVLQQVGREGVAQGMAGHLGTEVGLVAQLGDELLHRTFGRVAARQGAGEELPLGLGLLAVRLEELPGQCRIQRVPILEVDPPMVGGPGRAPGP